MTTAALESSTKIASKQNSKARKRAVPSILVRETINGIPFYYRGYKDVMNKKKTFEDIMADSGLQTLLKKLLYDVLMRQLDPQIYDIYMGEVGAHLDFRNNMGLDVAVFELNQLSGDKFDAKFLTVLPKFVIEVDMKVSLDDSGIENFAQFLSFKTQKLFDSGVERLIWVLNSSKKVVIAMPNEDWLIVDWNKDIELFKGVKINIGQILKERGINPDIF
jgi:hypothetical protein